MQIADHFHYANLLSGLPSLPLFRPEAFRKGSRLGRQYRSDWHTLRISDQWREDASRLPGAAPGHFYHYDSLEKEWLTRIDETRLAELETRYSFREINEVVISDRNLGIGYISGARLAPTHLKRSVLENSNLIARYLVGMFEFLENLFTRTRPDVILSYTNAGALSAATALVGKRLGIPYRQITYSRIRDLHVLEDCERFTTPDVTRAFEEARSGLVDLSEYFPEAREILNEMRSSGEQPNYQVAIDTYVRKSLGLLQLGREFASVIKAGFKRSNDRERLRKSSVFDLIRSTTVPRLRARRLLTPWRFLAPPAHGPYVFFPLQVDPEASTMVKTPMLTDQLHLIETLAKSIPLSINLVVKEHLPMVGRRPSEFYERISRLPRTYLSHPASPSIDLIKHARLVCVVTGTAGMEAMIHGVPVLVLGEIPTDVVGEGVVKCDNPWRLPEAVAKALTIEPVSNEALETWLAALLSQSLSFPPELPWESSSPERFETYDYALKHLVRQLLEAGGRS